jgi:hypothetical protein
MRAETRTPTEFVVIRQQANGSVWERSTKIAGPDASLHHPA